jgi:hypothetical protein
MKYRTNVEPEAELAFYFKFYFSAGSSEVRAIL